jgi:hypothetical protein
MTENMRSLSDQFDQEKQTIDKKILNGARRVLSLPIIDANEDADAPKLGASDRIRCRGFDMRKPHAITFRATAGKTT